MTLAATAAAAVAATLIVSAAWSADAAPGDTDTTYNPTAGCRITDTRSGADNVGPRSTPLGPDETYEITIHGSNGECTGPLSIPTDATGIAANVTAVGATTSSNIRIFPANLTEVPLLSNLNVTAGAPPTPNKVDVQLSPDGKIKAYNFKGNVHLVIDIVGYYTATSLKELAAAAATPGPAGIVELHNGYGPDTPAITLGATVARSPSSTTVTTDSLTGASRTAIMSINGPVSRDGSDYALSKITYCVTNFTSESTAVRGVQLTARSELATATLAAALDPVGDPGCYDVVVDDTQARDGIVASFSVGGDSMGDGVSFVGVTSTWTPLD